MSSLQYKIFFARREKIASDTYAFYFKKPNNFLFLAGQYIRLTVPHENPDARGTSRFFSLAAAPSDRYIVVITKDGPSSFKKQLLLLEPGTNLLMRGPYGTFVLDDKSSKPQVLITGGIGITPFISMIRNYSQKKLSFPLFLIASFSVPEEIVYQEEFEQIAQNNSSFHYIVTVTRPEDSNIKWNGIQGRINYELLKKYIQEIQNCVYYIVGPEKMVTALQELLENLGIAADNIKREDFTGY